MNLLSKLVGGTGASPAKQAGFDSPQQRSIRFRKLHDQLQQIWRRNNSAKQAVPIEPVLACFQDIKKTLRDEAQTPEPHLCARHVSTFQIYSTLSQVASTYHNEPIIGKTLDIFKVLINGEEVEFLEEKTFADALLGFIGTISTTGPLMVSVDTEGSIVEVLFAIASKIRLQPNLLPTWFRPNPTAEERDLGPHSSKDMDVFPLFYLTLDYVHHDGRVGDFARTGLLYIIESASQSEALERWIVESDLATLMASGLGALYSQLSRKLVVSFTKDTIPTILSFSETPRPKTPSDAEKTTSPDLQAHLATFLSYLVFWQDVLEHCGSEDVKRSLLDHFKFLFLQQLLYPSLMESSDVDGGSSVAVLTYLRCIIESIDNPELMSLTLQYLLAIPDIPEDERKPARPTTLARRRKSQTLITSLAQDEVKPMPDLFTLVDLVLTSLQSYNQQTVTATLRLISVILRSQHQFAMSAMIKTQYSGDLPVRTIGAHNRDTDLLFEMAEDLIFHDDLRDSYDAHLEDARTLLETHCCSPSLLPLPVSQMGPKNVIFTHFEERFDSLRPHSIKADDPLLAALISLLEDFLVNDIATNMGLTQVFATLLSCGNTRLEYWLLQEPIEYDDFPKRSLTSDDALDESDHDDTMTLNNRVGNSKQNAKPPQKISLPEPSVANHVSSPVFAALNSLVQQVETFRHDIQEFDTYLAEQRHVFKVGDDIDKDGANDSSAHSRRSEDSSRSTHSKSGNATQIGSISERLMSENSSANISRSSSPRGRQLDVPSTPVLVGRVAHLKTSPSPSLSKTHSGAFSRSSLRKDSITSTPPKRVITPMGPADALRQKVKIKTKDGNDRSHIRDAGSSETSSIRSGSVMPNTHTAEELKETTLSNLLTNIVILQEFILELAAIIQVRASLFGEVEFG
ncbi:MAG: hypothetical protein ASARMPRED_007304 [Alectoria sarmentosa]|nr:MAG: hypothetical protein ASARMPRED_007304 [Alectoria sarmentosa]